MSFISIGDEYAKKGGAKNPRHSGKQFITNPAKRTDGGGGCFDRSTYASEPFGDKQGYLEREPADKRKKGFGSNDAFRRDEFSNTYAVNAYREQLKREKDFNDKLAAQNAKEMSAEMASAADREAAEAAADAAMKAKPVHLYDIGRSVNTDFDPRSSRDTHYRYRGGDKRTGTMRTSTNEQEEAILQADSERPKAFGRVKAVRWSASRRRRRVRPAAPPPALAPTRWANSRLDSCSPPPKPADQGVLRWVASGDLERSGCTRHAVDWTVRDEEEVL